MVAAVRLAAGGRVAREVRTFATTTAGLLELAAWLAENGCTHVAMEATRVLLGAGLARPGRGPGLFSSVIWGDRRRGAGRD